MGSRIWTKMMSKRNLIQLIVISPGCIWCQASLEAPFWFLSRSWCTTSGICWEGGRSNVGGSTTDWGVWAQPDNTIQDKTGQTAHLTYSSVRVNVYTGFTMPCFEMKKLQKPCSEILIAFVHFDIYCALGTFCQNRMKTWMAPPEGKKTSHWLWVWERSSVGHFTNVKVIFYTSQSISLQITEESL